jgi:GT2 family glycosyltransferase
MKISVLVGSRNRADVLQQCLESVLAQEYEPFEVVVLDDASEDATRYADCLRQLNDPRIRLIRSDKQLGVAGGRNHLFQHASGDIFFVLDDDAVIAESDAITRLCHVFTTCPEIGIVACQIVEFCNDGKISRKLPFPRRMLSRFPYLIEKPQFVSYFLGTAHGIRRQVIETCGGYHSDLMFGEEELDLAYRTIENGWKIYYEPSITVHHRPQPSVVANRKQKFTELVHHIKNRIYLTYRYLPLPYAFTHLLFWFCVYSAMALQAKAPYALLQGIRAGVRMIRHVRRQPLSRSTLAYLHAHYGRLWY